LCPEDFGTQIGLHKYLFTHTLYFRFVQHSGSSTYKFIKVIHPSYVCDKKKNKKCKDALFRGSFRLTIWSSPGVVPTRLVGTTPGE